MENLVRVANKTDLQDVVEMSENLLEGRDYMTSSEFVKFLDDPNRTPLVIEIDGKAVGLIVIFIVDEQTTAMLEALRVHADYRGQGFGKRLVQATEQYIRDHFPAVKVHRHISLTESDSLSAMSTGHKTILREIVQLYYPITPSYTLVGKCVENVDQLQVTPITPDGFKELLERRKLGDIVPHETLIADRSLFKTLPSNISIGLLEDKDRLFISGTENARAITCLSHGRLSQRVKCVYWSVSIYTYDETLVKTHIVKQLQVAQLEFGQKPFIVRLSIGKPLKTAASDFVEKNLLLKPDDCFPDNLILVEKQRGFYHVDKQV